MRKHLLQCLCGVLMLVATWSACPAAGHEGDAASDRSGQRDPHSWRLSVGPVVQWGGRMEFSGPRATVAADLSLSPGNGNGAGPGTAGSPAGIPLPTDDITKYGNRTFDDGFVRKDTWTDDSSVPADRIGTTWNWSYHNASQYDADDLTLTFHRTSTRKVDGEAVYQTSSSRDVLYDLDAGGCDERPLYGIQLTLQRILRFWKRWRIELNGRVALFPEQSFEAFDTPYAMNFTQSRVGGASEYVATIRETYVYSDRFGIADPTILSIPVVAPAPYGGAGYSGPGPLLPNLPDSYRVDVRSVEAKSGNAVETTTWRVLDQVAVRADVQRLRLAGGLTLSRPLSRRLLCSLDSRVTMNLVSVHISRQETATITDTATGSSSVGASKAKDKDGFDCIPGAMLSANLDYLLSRHWFVGAYGGYEQLMDELHLAVGPDSVDITLGGAELSVYLGRRF